MFGLSMMQCTRRFASQLDHNLRHQLIQLYRPFRYTPCFLHRPLESLLKKWRKFPVIIEFKDDESFHFGMQHVTNLTYRRKRNQITHEFASISSCAGKLTAASIEQLLMHSSHVKKIHLDREVKALLNVATPSIRARPLNNEGLTGKNVKIAVVDTGISPHPDLTQPINRIVAFKDFVNKRSKPYDDNGHGTHCAGDAAGNGHASGGKYRGPAPNADLIGVKVLNRTGSGSLSTVIAGVEWCIKHKSTYSIDIITMSLGSPAQQSSKEDPVVKIVEEAWEKGIVVCVAAGNSGPDKNTISSPGISPKVITVGAFDDQNTVERSDDKAADFSSRGPTNDGIVKPDLLSPGVNIISLRVKGSYLDKTLKSARVGANYFSLSGTSMATPICAGASALLLQANPKATPDEIKTQLRQGSVKKDLPADVEGQGFLDVKKSLNVKPS